MIRRRTWRSLHSVIERDRSSLRVLPGLRNGVGILVPLVWGLQSGHLLSGIGVAVGALVAGFAGNAGTARRRLRTMLFATAWMSVTTFVGALAGHLAWLIVAVAALSAWLAGMMLAISQPSGQVGLLATNALILISTSPEPLPGALYRACLVACGGLLQTALMLAVDLVRPQSAEAQSVSNVYRKLGAYAASPSRQTDLDLAASLVEASDLLRDSYMPKRHRSRLVRLLDGAEQVRMYVVALAEIARGRSYAQELGDAAFAREILRQCAPIFSALGEHVWLIAQGDKRAQPLMYILERASFELSAIAQSAQGVRRKEETAAHIEAVARSLMALRDDLVQSDARASRPEGLPSPASKIKQAWQALKSHLTWDSAIFRHAIRVAVAVGVGEALAVASPWPHAYWVPLTANIILRPDFTSTFTRGIARVLGTMAGLVLATALLAAVPDRTGIFASACIVVFGSLMYMWVTYNYALFSCVLTALMVVLLSVFERQAAIPTMADRMLATLVGSALAIAIYLMWPTWQHQQVNRALAQAVERERDYFRGVLGVFAEGGKGSPRRLARERQAVRVSRTNAAAAVRQVLAEPVAPPMSAHTMVAILVGMHRFSDTLLSLEAYTWEGRAARPLTQGEQAIAAWVDRALSSLAEELRGGAGELAIDPSGELWRERSVLVHVEAMEMNWRDLDVIARAVVRLYHVIRTLARVTHEMAADAPQAASPE
ncbi:FUSC family protein [Alicyclobacillus sendaiensis]|uniref:FUSC family protein n=1 Tax=Alicyclobacillus sendaiensis PA2 TaxID=3029425 RepID=A0ABT6XVU9_ALISE|nr:FUSC family protein [Alicyclobacillus sendaiensis]MDI9259208.1 FUSC family protein [Alicyclobacillus sendaiensis PA2]